MPFPESPASDQPQRKRVVTDIQALGSFRVLPSTSEGPQSVQGVFQRFLFFQGSLCLKEFASPGHNRFLCF
jgi:hypothetical protein